MSKRSWHAALGALPDDAIALLHEERTGEVLTEDAIRKARTRAGIPPYSEPHRTRWFKRHGEEWEPPPDDFDW
jgi:hypothetical protein